MFKVPQYIQFEQYVRIAAMKTLKTEELREFWKKQGGCPFRMYLFFYKKTWWTSSKRIATPDLTNFIKATEDAICHRVGIDDRWNVGTSVHKMVAPTEHLIGTTTARLVFFKDEEAFNLSEEDTYLEKR